MAAVANHKTVGGGFSNERGITRVVYDFAEDGGTDDTAMTLLTASEAIVLTDFYAVVKKAVVGSSSTIKVGIEGGDDDALMDDVAEADLGANTLHYAPLITGTPNTRNDKLYLAAGAKIAMEIGTADLTAGKIEFVFEYARA